MSEKTEGGWSNRKKTFTAGVEQLMQIIELQAGQASEPYDHWSYAWRVARSLLETGGFRPQLHPGMR